MCLVPNFRMGFPFIRNRYIVISSYNWSVQFYMHSDNSVEFLLPDPLVLI